MAVVEVKMVVVVVVILLVLVLLVAVVKALVVQWAEGSILHRGPIEIFLLKNWYNKVRGICCPLCGILHRSDPLLLIRNSSPGSGCSGFPISLSGNLPYMEGRKEMII